MSMEEVHPTNEVHPTEEVHPKLKPSLKKSTAVRRALTLPSRKEPLPPHVSLARIADDIGSQETRHVIQEFSEWQFSLPEIVAARRSRDPESYKSAISSLLEETLQVGHGTNPWSATSVEAICKAFASDVETGLSESQIVINRGLYGENKAAAATRTPWWKFLVATFRSPISLLLALGFALTLAFKEWPSAIAIGVLVTASSVSSTLMEVSAAKALEALAKLSSPHCEVIRSDERLEIDTADLVVGDLVILQAGDSVPADIRLTEISDLKVNESLLTGEAHDVSKTVDIIRGNPGPFPQNLVFSSTTIVNGNGKGIVYAVGMNTQVGLIAEKLAQETAKGVKKTPLEVALDRLGGLIGIAVIIILVIILVVAWLTKYQDPSRPDQNRIVTIIILAVGFAVAAIPASLPAVVTSCFAMGCKVLKAQAAQVRRLPAVETLGCTSVICTDKTGTLTQAAMTAVHVDLIFSDSTEFRLQQTSCWPVHRYSPFGGIFRNEDMDAIHEKNARQLQVLNLANVVSKSPMSDLLKFVLLIGRLASPKTDVKKNEAGTWDIAGNSTDGAIVVAAAKAGWSDIPEIQGHVDPLQIWELDDKHSIPFSSSRKMEMCLYPIRNARERQFGQAFTFPPETAAFVCFKGAPEIVFDICDYVATQDSLSGKIMLETKTEIATQQLQLVQASNDNYSRQALRVLALGIIPLSREGVNQITQIKDKDLAAKVLASQPAYLVGLIACMDPPKHAVPQAIETCHTAGVRVIIITGDQIVTTEAIARKIGLNEASEVGAITCDKLNQIREESLENETAEAAIDELTAKYSIFCRARPEDKLTIVQSLQRQGHVVAMTGDGVNDAPALQTADIGVAMGITGTDVAKGASDLVLLDDNFATIVTAIREGKFVESEIFFKFSGRRIFGNVQRFVAFLLGTVFGETVYLTISILAGLKLPIDAIHVLFIGLICDALPAIAIGKEPSEPKVMRTKPRDRHAPILSKHTWLYGILPLSFFANVIVLGSTALDMYLSTGVVTARQLDDLCLRNESGLRYFCQVSEFIVSRDFNHQFVTHVDFIQDGKLVQYLGAIPGNFGTQILTPEDLGLDGNVGSV
eukprot:Gregarina_sp_Poly_1__4678@NODE_249_length_10714_cov_159_244576_g218_i0_p2_GENE_NODE_249_length_10714_cov_159_244576_g218_i0NODE_249_length_10714_cov_159_244576_g218_i0_p2_ORF_typecomplete_len1091_score184_55E1E2_ATPase/PF00122_20/6_1e03E1E2_ATPase/PF00122_20/1_1e46Hydrolase/PF00702_26/1_3e43Cation_ATPase_C/PF00689_21/9_9e02Cation_ATPase_C/PF00689_21/2_5e11Hydrolase_3/PF08282_12/6_8e03Hydrolase_3/PF08282_12/2_1e10Cation_ATPase_N/PF00690_26/5_4e10Cation_ATPase/PF13246_6/7_6e09HAD/PF12710_7/5_4e06T